jgi:hypothetical protein
MSAGDASGNGRNDLVLETGPSVLLRVASVPGTFAAGHTLR